MRSNRQLLVLLATLWFSIPALSQETAALPDAPPAHASDTSHIAPSKWYGVVDPGERVPPLYKKDKILFWLHEEVNPVGLLPAFISSGYAQLTDGDPKYGSDSGAYGERLGAVVLRQASMRFFSDSLLPTLTREDPRYFRKGTGGITARGLYAAERIFINQRDNGSNGFDYSDTVGRLGASALTMAYYPHESSNVGVVFKTWGLSLSGAAGNNLLLEFWPDIRDKIFHRHRN